MQDTTSKTLQATDAKPQASKVEPESKSQMPLLRNNFAMMIVAGVMIILGFALMAGGSSGVDEYNPDIFSTRRIVIGPLISFIGFVFMFVAIIVKPKGK